MLKKNNCTCSPVLGKVVATIAIATLVGACTNTQVSAPQRIETAKVEEVAQQATDMVGQTVSVRSKPTRQLGLSTFTVSDRQFFEGEPIVVVNATGKPVVLPEGDAEVQVTGTVARFVIPSLESTYNLKLNVDPNLYKTYEGKPAIVAKSIRLAPDASDINRNPQQYYGMNLTLPGKVGTLIAPNVFTLYEDKLINAQNVLVLVPNSQTGVTYGEKVVATGVVRPFLIADLNRDYNFNWDVNLQRDLQAQFNNQPVLIADRVYPLEETNTRR